MNDVAEQRVGDVLHVKGKRPCVCDCQWIGDGVSGLGYAGECGRSRLRECADDEVRNGAGERRRRASRSNERRIAGVETQRGEIDPFFQELARGRFGGAFLVVERPGHGN